MPLCLSAPVETDCCVGDICFQCRLNLPDSEQLVHDIQVAHWFNILVLLAVGVWNILSFRKTYTLYTNCKYHHYFPIMRLNNIIFAVGTALFIFSKTYYQNSKPTFILAAIHNLCEWVFTAFAFYQTRQERLYCIFGAFCFIFTVIGVIITVFDEFEQYALTEQVTGISMDFMLPILWFILYRQNKNKKQDKKEDKSDFGQMYLIAFAAHFVHLCFTILPIVVDNLTRNQYEMLSRLIQFAIFFSVPTTHILYTRFTTLHEQYVDLSHYTNNNNEPQETVGVYDDKYCVQFPSFGLIQTSFRRMLFWYIMCALIGSFPVFIIPQAVMTLNNGQYCHQSASNTEAAVSAMSELINYIPLEQQNENEEPSQLSLCNMSYDDDFVIGTASVCIYERMTDEFEEYINSANLVLSARNYEGNIFYYFSKNMDESSENCYLFVEGWKSMKIAYEWIESEIVDDVFNNYTYQMMINGGLNINGYIPLDTYCNDENEKKEENMKIGAIRNVFSSWDGCQDFKHDLSNFTECGWIPNCHHIEVIDEEEKLRLLVFDDNTSLHVQVLSQHEIMVNDSYTYFNYTMRVNELDRLSTIILISDLNNYGRDECEAYFKFFTNISIQSIDGIYTVMTTNNIPYLQSKYEEEGVDKVVGNEEINDSLCNLA